MPGTKIRTVDNLFIFQAKVSVFRGFGVRPDKSLWFLKTMNNKLTPELLKR